MQPKLTRSILLAAALSTVPLLQHTTLRAGALPVQDSPQLQTGPVGAARFELLLGRLRTFMRSGDIDQVVEARDTVYHIEALLRLYVGVIAPDVQNRDGYPTVASLKTLHDQFKSLDDVIGAYEQEGKVGHDDHASLESLKAVLSKEHWTGSSPNKIDAISTELAAIQWPSPDVERNMILDRVAQQLDFAQGFDYDMKDVEGGIHRLRKELRWYRYYAIALTTDSPGTAIRLLGTTPDRCATNGKTRSGPSVPSTVGECKVSQCLVTRMAELEKEMTALKAAGEKAIAAGNQPDKGIVERSKKVLQKVKDEQLLRLLAQEVRSCEAK